MARFRCRSCREEGEFEYRPGEHKCPRCGDRNVQFALAAVEIPDSILEQIEKLADGEAE